MTSGPNIGAMRHRVSFEAAIDTPASGGDVSRSWTGLGEVWAEIVPGNTGTVYAEARRTQEISHRIRVRHNDALKTADRIVLGARHFRVLGVVDLEEAGRVLEFRCREDTHR